MTDIEIGGDFVDVGTPEVTIAFFASGATAKFNVASVEVTEYVVKSRITRTNGYQCATAEVVVPRGVVTAATGDRLEIWSKKDDGSSYKEFDGYLNSVNPQGSTVVLFAYDKLYEAVRLDAANKTYDKVIDTQAGRVYKIFEDLLSQTGLSYTDGTTIQDTTATGITLDKFVCNDNDIFDRLVALAKSVNWQFYYHPNTDKVYFEPKGYSNAGSALVVGSNIVGKPQWTSNTTEMVNVLTLKGAVTSVRTTELFSGDGSTTTFNLTNVPTITQVQYPIGTVKTGGVLNSTATYDYYINDFVTSDGTHIPKIKFLVAPAVGVNNIQVDYAYDEPTPITVNGPSLSRSTYGDFKKTIVLNTALTVQDAYTFGNTLVTNFSSPFLSASFKYYDNSASNDYFVGRSISVTDSINNYTNQTLIISKQIVSYPNPVNEIQAGQKEWRLADAVADLQDRLARVEQAGAGQNNSSTIAQGAGAPVNLSRYTLVETVTNVNDQVIYNIRQAYNTRKKYNNQGTNISTTTYTY